MDKTKRRRPAQGPCAKEPHEPSFTLSIGICCHQDIRRQCAFEASKPLFDTERMPGDNAEGPRRTDSPPLRSSCHRLQCRRRHCRCSEKSLAPQPDCDSPGLTGSAGIQLSKGAKSWGSASEGGYCRQPQRRCNAHARDVAGKAIGALCQPRSSRSVQPPGSAPRYASVLGRAASTVVEVSCSFHDAPPHRPSILQCLLRLS